MKGIICKENEKRRKSIAPCEKKITPLQIMYADIHTRNFPALENRTKGTAVVKKNKTKEELSISYTRPIRAFLFCLASLM